MTTQTPTRKTPPTHDRELTPEEELIVHRLCLWNTVFRTVSELEDIERAFRRRVAKVRSLLNSISEEFGNAEGHEEN